MFSRKTRCIVSAETLVAIITHLSHIQVHLCLANYAMRLMRGKDASARNLYSMSNSSSRTGKSSVLQGISPLSILFHPADALADMSEYLCAPSRQDRWCVRRSSLLYGCCWRGCRSSMKTPVILQFLAAYFRPLPAFVPQPYAEQFHLPRALKRSRDIGPSSWEPWKAL